VALDPELDRVMQRLEREGGDPETLFAEIRKRMV